MSSSNSAENECAICLSNLRAGQGQAIFTAECSHSFHFNCIAKNVKHGNLCCPVCRHVWKSVPFQAPDAVANPPPPPPPPPPLFDQFQSPSFVDNRPPFRNPFQQIRHYDRQFRNPYDEPRAFSDDEPLPTTSPTPSSPAPQSLAIKTYTEYSAIAAAESRPRFPVLVNIRAPPLPDTSGQGRTPIDLVMVLDVSGSMNGEKIGLLKQAVKFVIENLGDSDRLSIVSFSHTAQRVLPLRRMSAGGRECAVRAVESLTARGGTDIVRGLEKGVKVLRRARNPVSSIILLSDGQDNCHYNVRDTTAFVNCLPAAVVRSRNIPVHAFGFGTDHDAIIMNAISDSSGGTFSFIESVGMVQDAFAMCIGGLLSVVAQELRLTVRSASPGVQIVSIPSGRHESTISDEGQEGVVDVGSMYAEEEKQFLVYLLVPAYSETGNGESKTPLLDVSCAYKDLASNELNQVQGDRVEILRPEAWSSADESVCLEVDRERNRISAAEAIAEAQVMAESGNFEAAQVTLQQRRETISASTAALEGDDLSNWLNEELVEIGATMASSTYAQTGRAYALAGLSSHTSQRATARGDRSSKMFAAVGGFGPTENCGPPGASRASGRLSASGSRGGGYETAAMLSMVKRSQQQNHEASHPQKKSRF